MTTPLTAPNTGQPLPELQPGETLARIAWAGKRPVVVLRTDPEGRQRYRLATGASAASPTLRPEQRLELLQRIAAAHAQGDPEGEA
ncbi:hypothetical protein KBZ20_16375 [Vulcanococcus limneticus Candia 3F8]|uniref:hypothetical protein n=1 Tax=Vulcanococcus limneticus TaxID=2170428 RepID=UPI0020CCC665|nr:hypothetical protein [Vulcanococcus limneticus]MCP9793341.1 hypothetical protein [Vulcanococcus limneticus MW73D5]MCP9895343.1 hypothetical protein [Vulcanococcus limneticus Candia 3F8]MCP9898739.1 hypothetical protein [Vulcanococcus limneticus Candia 3B3]